MANKPKSQRPTDHDVRTAENLIKVGEERSQREISELKKKLEAMPWIYEQAGKFKALKFTESQARLLKLVVLKEVKENKEYREKLGLTWEEFCETANVDRRWIDEQLADLKPFKTEFLKDFICLSGFDFNKIKYLGQKALDESLQFSGRTIVYNGEKVSLDDPDQVRDLVEKIEEDIKREKEERRADKKAHERVQEALHKEIVKLQKSLSIYSQNALAKGLTPEEDAFIRQCENYRIAFEGYMLSLDPERITALDGDSTYPMRAAYLSTLDYMKKRILAAVDIAYERFGDARMSPELAYAPTNP